MTPDNQPALSDSMERVIATIRDMVDRDNVYYNFDELRGALSTLADRLEALRRAEGKRRMVVISDRIESGDYCAYSEGATLGDVTGRDFVGDDLARITRREVVANAVRSTGHVTNSDKWEVADAVIAAMGATLGEGREVSLLERLEGFRSLLSANTFRDRLFCMTETLDEAIAIVRASLAAPTAQRVAAVDEWRCFHCEEVFTDRESAAIHFGSHEHQRPACLIDAAEYRRMEAKEASYVEEDAAIHRQMHGMHNEHQVALRRAEEAGYANGLRDAALYPEDSKPTPPPTGEAVAWQRNCTLRDWRGAQWHECTKEEHDSIVALGYWTDAKGFNWPSEARALYSHPAAQSAGEAVADFDSWWERGQASDPLHTQTVKNAARAAWHAANPAAQAEGRGVECSECDGKGYRIDGNGHDMTREPCGSCSGASGNVERAAIALFDMDDCKSFDPLNTWRALPEYGRDRYRDRARAALTAAPTAQRVAAVDEIDKTRLWDSQYVNIVNDPDVLGASAKRDAVAKAVKMTEQRMAENFARYLSSTHPPTASVAAGDAPAGYVDGSGLFQDCRQGNDGLDLMFAENRKLGLYDEWPAECDWPDRSFTVKDMPGEHEPCYLIMPGGEMLAFVHHATNGVDQARAQFVADACNAARRPTPPPTGEAVVKCPECMSAGVLYECVACSATNYPAAQAEGRGVDDAMVERALNAQPFAVGRNSSLRVWQLFDDHKEAATAMRAALESALTAPADVGGEAKS